MTNNRLSQFSQSMSGNGFADIGDPRDDDPLIKPIENSATLKIVRRLVIQRPGTAILAGLVVGGILGWLISRNK